MDRTYVFNSDGGNGCNGGSKFDITALLPGMFGSNRGVDPGLLALLNQGRNNQDAWGGGCWFVWIILMWFIWGNNGFFGFGGNRGGGCNGLPLALNGDAGRELLMQAIQGNSDAIRQLSSSFNCSTQQMQTALCNLQSAISQVGNQVGLTGTQIINAIQSGNNSVITQIADCCCKTQNAITTMGYQNQLANCEQTNTLVNNANQNALSLRDGATANTNAILSKLSEMQNQAQQDKIASLTSQLTAAQSEISQRNQNATILNNVSQQIAPLVAAVQALQGDVDGIKCKLPNTVSVPYPQLHVYNPEVARAAAYGAAAGNYAGGYGCGCGYGSGFFG